MKTKEQCDYINSLRDYEAAHKAWMNTPVFGWDGLCRRVELFVKRNAYIRAYKAANPTHSVI